MTPFGTIKKVMSMYFQRIRDLREDHDKTQQEIAAYLNMHRSVYRRYELGQRELPLWAAVEDAAAKLVKVIDTVDPDPELAAKYEERYAKFRKLYPALKETF